MVLGSSRKKDDGNGNALHKLCAEGYVKRAYWERVIAYLNDNCGQPSIFNVSGAKPVPVPNFQTPLPRDIIPSRSLLEDCHESRTRDGKTPLAVAALRAPSDVMAALCHVCPEAASIPDARRRLPLHIAAGRPTGGLGGGNPADITSGGPGADSHRVLRILIEAYPQALVARDSYGRTPLHYLFLHFPESRSVATVNILCRNVVIAEFEAVRNMQRAELMEMAVEEQRLRSSGDSVGAQNKSRALVAASKSPMGGSSSKTSTPRRSRGQPPSPTPSSSRGTSYFDLHSPRGDGNMGNLFVSAMSEDPQEGGGAAHPLPPLPLIPAPRIADPSSSSLTAADSLDDSSDEYDDEDDDYDYEDYDDQDYDDRGQRRNRRRKGGRSVRSESRSTVATTPSDWEIPPSAAVIPDSVLGCTPLHYAVMEGASREAIQCLLSCFPAGVAAVDRHGRTPLHWYLGAGTKWNVRGHVGGLSSHSGEADGAIVPLGSRDTHSEFAFDDDEDDDDREGDVASSLYPSRRGAGGWGADGERRSKIREAAARAHLSTSETEPMFRSHRSSTLVSLLLNEKVACIRDLTSQGELGRLPLHWAVWLFTQSLCDIRSGGPGASAISGVGAPRTPMSSSMGGSSNSTVASRSMDDFAQPCITLKCIRRIVEANPRALVVPDGNNGHTPLHVIFATVHEWNEIENRCLAFSGNNTSGNAVTDIAPLEIPSNGEPMGVLVPIMSQAPARGRSGDDDDDEDADGVAEGGEGKKDDRNGAKNKRRGPKTFAPPRSLLNLLTQDIGPILEKLNKSAVISASSASRRTTTDSIEVTAAVTPDEDDVEVMSRPMATLVEDKRGYLPLHYAVVVACPAAVVSILISTNPTSLIHAGNDDDALGSEGREHRGSGNDESPRRSGTVGGRTPFHMAFASPYTTQLQTLEMVAPLLPEKSDDSNQGVLFDARVALKMEDSSGRCPLHLAAENGAHLDILEMLVKEYPSAAQTKSEDGNLPVHLLLDPYLFINLRLMALERQPGEGWHSGLSFDALDKPDNADMQRRAHIRELALKREELARNRTRSAVFGQLQGWTSDSEERRQDEDRRVMQKKIHLLIEPLLNDADSLAVADSQHAMLPIHIAVAFNAAPYGTLHRMLRVCPHSARFRTTRQEEEVGRTSAKKNQMNADAGTGEIGSGGGGAVFVGGYTPLDLHAIRRRIANEVGPNEIEAWHAIRELLFGYQLFPLEEDAALTHRRDIGLISRCVEAVRAEAQAQPSVHVGPDYPVDPAHVEMGFVLEEEANPEEETTVADGSTFSPRNSMTRRDRPANGEAIQRWAYGASDSESAEDVEEDDGDYDDEDEDDYDDDEDDYDDESMSETYDGDLRSLRTDEEYLSRSVSGSSTPTGGVRSDEFSDRDVQSPVSDKPKSDRAITGQPVRISKMTWNGIDRRLQLTRHTKSTRPRSHMSDVATRIWTFFATFQNPSDPQDHYARQVEEIVDELPFDMTLKLVSMALPDVASTTAVTTFGRNGRSARNILSIRDTANTNCKAVIHSAFYFAGRYDFTPPLPGVGSNRTDGGTSILLHRSADAQTLLLRATENRFSTKEEEPLSKAQSTAVDESLELPDVSDIDPSNPEFLAKKISGAPDQGVGFSVSSRLVCVKFLKDRSMFEREFRVRQRLDAVDDDEEMKERTRNHWNLLPLLASFDATNTEEKSNRRYQLDIGSERFKHLRLFSSRAARLARDGAMSGAGWKKLSGEQVDISSYPFAMVFPFNPIMNLYDTLHHEGMDDIDVIKNVCADIGHAVQSLHDAGIIHGNLSLDDVVAASQSFRGSDCGRRWILTNLSMAMEKEGSGGSNGNEHSPFPSFVGAVSKSSVHTPQSSLLPPEMFVKLDYDDLQLYETYWKIVAQRYEVTFDEDLIRPKIDPSTGEAYVIKRCYVPDGDDRDDSVDMALPYIPVAPTEAIDLWAFGVLMFQLCSGGQSLFAINSRTGELTSYSEIVKWNEQAAEQAVYDHVHDPLAQDLLLHLLSPPEERSGLTMGSVLSHPFFSKIGNDTNEVVQTIIDLRISGTQTRQRWMSQQLIEKRDRDWLNGRTVSMTYFSLDTYMKMTCSTTSLVKAVFEMDSLPTIPYSLIVLPYAMARSRSGKLTPSSKRDVELAENVGKHLLAVSKVTSFVVAMGLGCREKTAEQAHELMRRWVWMSKVETVAVTEEIVATVGHPDFKDTAKDLIAKLKELGEEASLSLTPVALARKLLQDAIRALVRIYTTANTAFLYLVDEYTGLPIVPVHDTDRGIYPHQITVHVDDVVRKLLPFMQISALCARGVARSVAGVVRLIFEGAYPHVPPSWLEAGRGLPHELDMDMIVSEVQVLKHELEAMDRGGDSASPLFIKSILSDIDRDRSYAQLKRVTDGRVWLWTTDANVTLIAAEADHTNVLREYKRRCAEEASLRENDKTIEELETTIRELKNKQQRARSNGAVPESPNGTHSNGTNITSNSVSTPTTSTILEKRLGSSVNSPSVVSSPVSSVASYKSRKSVTPREEREPVRYEL